jgi:alpha-L-rhamnosidase
VGLTLLGLFTLGAALNAAADETAAAVSSPRRRTGALPLSFSSTFSNAVYLPLVWCSEGCAADRSIWTHAVEPAPHEVVLFRRAFTLDEPMQNSEIEILADTRYELWFDGAWVGRGPARFSQTIREYDVHPLGDLEPGQHLVAALVQWAPNNRRSESVEPFLQAHVDGIVAGSLHVPVRTGAQWKALPCGAWQRDAAPVHAWGLIGPTELLDLRQLPADWTALTFSDADWPAAVERNPDHAPTGLRSIALLADAPVTATVIDAGALSPGRAVAELMPSVPDPFHLGFEALDSTALTVEMLSGLETVSTDAVQLDGAPLIWSQAGTHRPDVSLAVTQIAPGAHSLTFSGVPDDGLTVGLATQDLRYDSLPFGQGLHAGRRALLAEPVSDLGQVVVSGDAELSIEFVAPPAYAVLDLGRVIHGRLTAEITGPAGTVVDVGWDERLWQGTRPLPYPGSLHSQWNQVDSWVLDGTPRTASTLDARAGRYVLIAVWGDGPVRLEGVRVAEERYPVSRRGAFASSNERLDRVWQVGVDTLYPNMTDAYTDTPWRERGQWWGDAYVQDQINRVAFGDTALLRRCLLLMARAFQGGRPDAMAPNGGHNHMLDYGMLWVQSLRDYWQSTADSRLLAEVYPTLQEFMDYLAGYENPATGLLDIPPGHWSQTVLIDWAAASSRYGQSTAVNALYCGTLEDAAAVAQALGDTTGGRVWSQKADLIRQGVNAHLYRDGDHRYVATLFDGQTEPPSPHAQAWALAYGLVPESEVGAVASSLLQLLSSDPSSPNVEVYGMFWVLKALGRAGRVAEALEVVENYYGRMLDLGATTWWEGFNAHTSYTSSLSHGWGGSPTWFLTTYVLGARRLGVNRWQVRPAFEGVIEASGSLPLQAGELQVTWERQICEEADLEVTAPISSSGEIVMPFSSSTMVLTLNGQVVWQDGAPLVEGVTRKADGLYVTLEEGGSFVLHVHQECYYNYLPLVTR